MGHEGVVTDFSKDGLRFSIAPHGPGWCWSVVTMDGQPRDGGTAPSRAAAAACIVRATLCQVDWPSDQTRRPQAA